MTDSDPTTGRWRRIPYSIVTVAIAVTVVGSQIVNISGFPTAVTAAIITYGVALAPMSIAAAIIFRGRFDSLIRGFRPVDALIGCGVGLFVHSISAGITTLFVGQSTTVFVMLADAASAGIVTVIGAIATVVLAPVVEEIVFRGALQPALARSIDPTTPMRPVTQIAAVLLSSLVFAGAHALAQLPAPLDSSVITLVVTLAAGLCFGLLASWRKNIVGAVVAHATFNACALWLPS